MAKQRTRHTHSQEPFASSPAEAAQIRIETALEDLQPITEGGHTIEDWARFVLAADALYSAIGLIYDELYMASRANGTIGRKPECPIGKTLEIDPDDDTRYFTQ